MSPAALVASIIMFAGLASAESGAGPGVLRWTFANGRVVTAVLSEPMAGIFLDERLTAESRPLIPGRLREISVGRVRTYPESVKVVPRDDISFDNHAAAMFVVDDGLFVLSQDRRLARLEFLRPPNFTEGGYLHLGRIHRVVTAGRESIVINVQWREAVHVGTKYYWGETHLVRDDGVTVRFGLLEGTSVEPDPQVSVADDILTMKKTPRQLDLRALEAESTVATGFVSRASDASNQTLDGWTRVTELFNPVVRSPVEALRDVGTDDVVDRALRSLTRGRRSVVLRGRAGVGKRTLAGEVIARLPRTWTAFALTPDAIDSASAFTGNFSARLLAMKAASETRPVVWLMPRVHGFRDLGTHSKKSTDFFDGIADEMKSGALRVLGTAEDEEWGALVRGRAEVSAHFDAVDVPEAPETRVAEIALARVRRRGVGIGAAAYRQMRAWGRRFGPRVGEPGRTVELLGYALDEAVERGAPVAEMEDVRRAVRRRFAVPPAYLDLGLARQTLERLDAELARRLPGNDGARAAVVAAARSALLDLRPPDRPVATGLLAGPRGAGKTSLVEAFADVLDLPVLTLPMSSYLGEWTVRDFQRAFGEFAEAHPVGIVFLDELEKSAPKVQDVLLKGVESESFGYTGDHGLKTAPTSNLIVIGATNAGEETVMQAARNGRPLAPGVMHAHVTGPISPYLVDRFDFVEPQYPSSDEIYRRVARAQVDRALAHFGIGAEQIVGFDELIDAVAGDRSALGSNREAGRATFRVIGDAIGRMLSRGEIADRAQLPELRYRFDQTLRLECGDALEKTPSGNVVPFGPRTARVSTR